MSPERDDENFNYLAHGQSVSRLLLFASCWIAIPLIFFTFSGSKLPGYILPAVPGTILFSSIYIYRFMRKGEFRRRLVEGVVLVTFAVVMITEAFVVPNFARKESVKDLIAAADRHGYGQSQVASFLTVSHNAEFYAFDRLIRDEEGKQRRFVGPREIRDFIDQHDGKPLVVLTPKEHIRHLTSSELLDTQVLDDNGELDVAIVKGK